MKGYFAEAKRNWWANRNNKSSNKNDGHEKFDRRPSLRGKDFVRELARLFSETQDRRFRAAIDALTDHVIVDGKLNFRRWRAPAVAKLEVEIQETLVQLVLLRMESGKSQRRACAEVAASAGVRARTFEAAVKHLQIAVKASGKTP